MSAPGARPALSRQRRERQRDDARTLLAHVRRARDRDLGLDAESLSFAPTLLTPNDVTARTEDLVRAGMTIAGRLVSELARHGVDVDDVLQQLALDLAER